MRTALLTVFLCFAFFNVFSQIKLDSGLVAYYPFNGNANDSSGHGNNPIFNNATLTTDMYGNANKAYHFDGTSSYMRIANSGTLNMGTQMTICVNVRPLGFNTSQCHSNTVVQKGDNDYTSGNYAIRFSDTINPCGNSSTTDEHFYGDGGAHASQVVQLNTWYNVVWTYDGSVARIYINGTLSRAVTVSISSFTNSYDLFLGRMNDAVYPYFFNGDLDEVRFYNRAINSQEVSALYTLFAKPTITSFSPVSAGSNTTVTITGTNFTGATAVSFGGVNAAAFAVSPTKITARVGAGASGNVSVTTPGGIATLGGFTYCVTPSVKVTANKTSPLCGNTKVTFTAKPANEGTTPVYQWIKNGLVVGTNSTTYVDSLLVTGDTVYCKLTSNASPCVTTSTVSSAKLTFTVAPVVTPSVSIISNTVLPVCTGANVSFTATPVNGGTAPVYQWMKNGVNAGTNSTTYTDSLAKNGDSILVKMTTNAACATAATAVSNVVKIAVDAPNPAISISANKDTSICASTAVTFTATVNPVYLWKKDGVVVGNGSNTYKDSLLKNGDYVQCFLVSSAAGCNSSSSNILNSNKLKFAVKAAPVKPSSISGPTSVKAGQTGIYFSVTAAAGVTYAWTLPSGALIDSGQGGYKIKVNWGTTAGNVSVIVINDCGSSLPVTKAVTVTSSLTKASIAIISEDNSITATNSVKLYPNPAGTFTNLQFTATVAAKYTITISDAQDKVLEVKNGVSVKGRNTVKINTGSYAKGTYFVTIANKEDGRRSKQLVIAD